MKLKITTAVVALFVLSVTHTIEAQPASVAWFDDSEAAVTAAQKSSLPILFLVLPRSDEPSTPGDHLKKSFDDPAVKRLVSRRFIAVNLKRSTANNALLKRLDASEVPNGSAVIATPGGSGLDIVATNDVRDAQRLVQRLAEAFGKYQARVLANSVAPVLGNEEAKSKDLLASLRLVKKLELSQADKAIEKMLGSEKLGDGVRAAAYDALAALSTERSIEALLDSALEHSNAASALRSCTPAGAAAMLASLTLKDRKRLVAAYDAVSAICSIGDAKPAEFWQGDDKASQKAEIDRVKALVSTCAQGE